MPSFYPQHGRAVLSMAILKHNPLSMHEYFTRTGSILKYSSCETPDFLKNIKHRIARQILTDLDIFGVDFNSSTDVPTGTWMGSSSAFAVGPLKLCHAYRGRYVSRAKLAELACEMETHELGELIGKQGQYGCALGGIHLIRFLPDETVVHEPVPLTDGQREKLENTLALFYLGGKRSASALLATLSRNSAFNAEVIENLKATATQAEALCADFCRYIDVLGAYLHEGWQRKRRFANGHFESAHRKPICRLARGGHHRRKPAGRGKLGPPPEPYPRRQARGRLRRTVSLPAARGSN